MRSYNAFFSIELPSAAKFIYNSCIGNRNCEERHEKLHQHNKDTVEGPAVLYRPVFVAKVDRRQPW